MEANEYLREFYGAHDEDARLASRHGSVEFLTTMRYIERYLKPGGRVIEIGAGTGRYAHALARQGYAVDAIELLERHVGAFEQNTQPGERVTVTQGDALDLTGFADNTYDLTLLLGPLYHLFTKEDKLRALYEAIRVTKRGGVVFAAYCVSDGCILDSGFRRGKFDVAAYIERGLIDPVTFAARSEPKELFELVRKEQIDELMRNFKVTRLHYVAADGYTMHMPEAVDGMDAATFELYLRYHFATCERADMAGLTSHAIDVFRKG